ncbi:MAG: anaerobic ribonucleoside-triphosphate reductase activating protein [Planctomycetes bacterium]|nr:anaerobic ribonucleoside-triphosphate reductase activating protein [Planctomycetota bacterium]
MELKLPPIRGLLETSLTHWPGRLSSVVFLGGCTLRCPTCPVPHLIGWGREQGAIPFDSILDALYRRRRWIEGVVVKGGEPFAHPDLPELLGLLADLGFPVRVDSNGTRPAEMEAAIAAQLVDCVTVDLKAPLDGRYLRAAGADVALRDLFRSIEALLAGDVDYEFRTAVRAGGPAEADVLAIARTIRGARRWVLRAAGGRDSGVTGLTRLAREAGRFVREVRVEGRGMIGSFRQAVAVEKDGRNDS